LHFWLIFYLKLFVAINIGNFLNKKSQLKKASCQNQNIVKVN